jgi:hypothetical protein
VGVAVVRRQPSFLEELGQRLIPALLGQAIEDGKRRSYAAAEQGLYQSLFDQVRQAPGAPPLDVTPQTPSTPWDKAYGVPQGGNDASWLDTWDQAHRGTNDPMALLGQAIQSDFAKKYGAEGAMKGFQSIMGVVDAQQQAQAAAANRSGMDSLATHMGSQNYDYRSPHQVMPDWMRFGMYGGNQGEFTDILQHLSPNMKFQEMDLGDQKLAAAFDPGTGAFNPLLQAPVGVSPDTRYAQNAQTARNREDWALRAAERRADPKYQLMVQAHERYQAGDRTPEVMQALNLAQTASSQNDDLFSPSELNAEHRLWTGGVDPLTGRPLQSWTVELYRRGVSSQQLKAYILESCRAKGKGLRAAEQVYNSIINSPTDPYFIPMEERALQREEDHVALAKDLLAKGWSPEEILAEASDTPEAYRIIRKFFSGKDNSPLMGRN